MDNLTHEDVKALSQMRQGPYVSIYLPTHRNGEEKRQDQIRLKNSLRQAEEQLIASGMRSPEAKDLLHPPRALLDDSAFWRSQGDGLALFRSPEVFRSFRLPRAFEELTLIGSHFHIKPLLPLLCHDGRFFVLAFSEKEVRLFEGSERTFREVQAPQTPGSLAEALKYDVPDKQTRFHTITATGHSDRGHAIYHGQGTGADDDKDRIYRFFQAVDRGLQPLLKDERAPLILAGVESRSSLYRQANTYPFLLEPMVAGNPQRLNERELHNRAWEVARTHFDRGRQEAARQYRELSGSPRASNRLADVLPAANRGKVQFLFVPANGHQWGAYFPANGDLQLHPRALPGDEDLLDRAALDTFTNRGMVYAVEPEEMPDGGPVAAVYRY